MAGFFRRYARAAAGLGTLRLCFLRHIDGRPAAAQQPAIETGERFWLLKIGYDPVFGRCSPGTLLIAETIRHAAARGLRAYEFLGAVEPWTALWTEQAHRCVALGVFPLVRGGRPRSRPRPRLSSAGASREQVADASGRRARGPCLHLAGSVLADALRVADAASEHGLGGTLGYWDGPDEAPAEVAAAYEEAIAASRELGWTASVKAPSLGGRQDLVCAVAAHGPVVHFDSLASEQADRTLAAAASDGAGCTLPGRWARSVADAEAAVEGGIDVRIVKGQWAASGSGDVEPRSGFLAVVDRLAGRARSVAIATHDAPLADEAVRRLVERGTDVRVELLLGLPPRAAAAVARRRGVPLALYIPLRAGLAALCPGACPPPAAGARLGRAGCAGGPGQVETFTRSAERGV